MEVNLFHYVLKSSRIFDEDFSLHIRRFNIQESKKVQQLYNTSKNQMITPYIHKNNNVKYSPKI